MKRNTGLLQKNLIVICLMINLNLAAQTYHEGDINCLKAFKENNDPTNMLGWDFSDPGNLKRVTWSETEPKRVIKLNPGGIIITKDVNYGGKLVGNIDLTRLTELTEFSCTSNRGVVSLNVSNLKKLKSLYSLYCKISILNIDGCSNLEVLNCEDNQLTSLNVTALENLTSLDCAKNSISELKVDNLINLQKLVCNSNNLSFLPIEKLINLKTLDCSNNQITELNVDVLTKLTDLYCNNNQISSLNVTQLSELKFLDCENNQLSSLDVEHLDNLIILACSMNKIKELKTSKLTNLEDLICFENQLSELSTENLTKLYSFDCSDNHISYLNIENSKGLFEFGCHNNRLKLSNLHKCRQVVWANIHPNENTWVIPSYCDLGEQKNVGEPLFLNIEDALDLSAEYVFDGVYTRFDINFPSNCYTINNGIITFHYPGVYNIQMFNASITGRSSVTLSPITVNAPTGIDPKEIAEIRIYPNPVSDILYVEGELSILGITIFNTTGQLQYKGNETSIPVSDWSKGTYFIKIETPEKVLTKKFIVK